MEIAYNAVYRSIALLIALPPKGFVSCRPG